MDYYSLKNDKKIISWLSTVDAKPSTEKNYLRSMEKYTNLLKKAPIELYDEARADIERGVFLSDRSIKDDLNGFRDDLKKKGLSPLSVKAHMAGVKSFFKSFDIEIPKSPRSETTALPKKENHNKLEKEELQEVLMVCDPLERAILLTEVASGLSAQEMINLKISDFKNGYDSETEITTLELRREKVNFDFTTFLTPEASGAVWDYLAYRNRKCNSKDPRRIDQVKKQNEFSDDGFLFIVRLVSNEFLETMDEELRKIDEPSFLMMYRIISERAGKSTAKGKWNKIRSHNIRKYFSSTLYNAGLDLSHIDSFQGHKPNNSREPYIFDDPKQLKEIYKKYMPYLTIQKDLDPEQHPDFIRLKKESETYARAAANATVERSELIDLTTKNKDLEGKYQDLESRFVELKKFQNEDQESRRKNRIIKNVLAAKYSPEYPKNADPSVWLIEHERLMETDLNYKKDYELCEKAESIEGFTKGEEFQIALENGDKESNERKKKLANLINKLTSTSIPY